MALRWNFKEDKLGWYEDDKTRQDSKHIIRLYDGNALMIATVENDETQKYYMHSFFADEKHAENCLKEDPIYPKEAIFHLYRKRKCNKLARILTKYHYSIIWEDEECTTKEQ